MNVKSYEERKNELKSKLDNKYYNKEDDISLFISEFNIIFKELEKLDKPLTKEKKCDYLFLSLPDEIAIRTNIIIFQGKWKEVSEHLIKIIPYLKYVKESITK
jgi:seryl-tRNA synthetase